MINFEIPAYISVDIESSGPTPGLYSLLSIGACTISKPRRTFYVELKPITQRVANHAMEYNKLSLEKLEHDGLAPEEAMKSFEDWILHSVPSGVKPIMVAFNAPFEWMFINDYFYKYLGRNPFGHSALDVKSYYMGARHTSWLQTSFQEVSHHYMEDLTISHHALQDAIDQAVLFQKVIATTKS